MEQKPKVEHTDTEIDDDDESIHSNEVVTNKNLDTANTEHNGNAQIVRKFISLPTNFFLSPNLIYKFFYLIIIFKACYRLSTNRQYG